MQRNADALQRIRADREHGASWLARVAAQALAEAVDGPGEDAERLAQAHALARDLALARPSMAAIANTVAHIWWTAQASGLDTAAQVAALRAEARAVDARWGGAVAGMTAWARGTLRGPIYTLSRSASVEGTLTALARERQPEDPLRVVVSESRPGGEGVALANALANVGAHVTLVVDGACAAFIDDVAFALIGSDSVRADGSVVNKIGTHTLALVAQSAGKPVYALAESLKITAASYPLVIEEMPPEELAPNRVAGVTPRNLYFDVTPARLISGIVTEHGLLSLSELAQLAEQAERAYQTLMRP